MTNKQYKILKYISKHNDVETICNKFNCNYQELQYKLPNNSLEFNSDCTLVHLADWIASDVESRHRDSFRFALPIIISITALIGAYRQELALLIQAIAKLLK